MKSLSVVVLTRNNEDQIKACLESASFADEIVVVDDYSTDSTLKRARSYTQNIYKRHLSGDFSAQRNFGLSKTTGEWVLFVDSDEIVPKSLQEEITTVLVQSDKDGFFIRRHDRMWGRTLTHGEIGDVTLLRLGKKEKGTFEGRVHEVWNIKEKTGYLTTPFVHIPHQSIGDFVSDINTYTTLRAKELFEQNVSVSMFDIIAFPLGKFFNNYILRLGFLDGIQGLMFAICMSFHSFLVRGKLRKMYDTYNSNR